MLNRILEMETKELFNFLAELFENRLDQTLITDGDNYLFYPSRSPLCLVAHMDTVRPAKRKVKLEQTGQIITNRNGVLGADDRAGVFAIVQLLLKCKDQGRERPSVLFTNYEEIGGVGVQKFIDDCRVNPFEKTRLLIELDRRGANDYVYYNGYLPDDVKDYVEAFGFVESSGSYSDIADLTDAFMIPSVNLSVGYYNEHSVRERLHVDELQLTIDRVLRMIGDPIDKLYPMEPYDEAGFAEYEDPLLEEQLVLEDPFMVEDFESQFRESTRLERSFDRDTIKRRGAIL